MVSIRPIVRALAPADSEAALAINGPNYDEFQSDDEIRALVEKKPRSILRVTMPHCDATRPGTPPDEGSPGALDRAAENLEQLSREGLLRPVENALFIYQMIDPRRPGIRQIGLGGVARTSQIRTDASPDGTIIRNEGIHEYKARGRADLIRRVGAYIGMVNCAVDDATSQFSAALEAAADRRSCDFQATDEHGTLHQIWLISDSPTIESLVALLADEPCAYVADGNHRSAAAAMLGYDAFLAVFFPVGRMGISPYHRLVGPIDQTPADVLSRAAQSFDIESLGAVDAFQPAKVHSIGWYDPGGWRRLTPKPSTFRADSAVESIDADIVQRKLFADVLDIADPRDKRLRYVGGDRSAAYLREQVDQQRATFALAMAPVTMQQFVDVCRQNQFMPPKSTWFEPKLRSGMVIARVD